MNLIQNLLAYVFGLKTTDSVLNAFNKSINELEEVRASHEIKAEKRRLKAAKAAREAAEAEAEVERATQVKQRLSDLISVVPSAAQITQQ